MNEKRKISFLLAGTFWALMFIVMTPTSSFAQACGDGRIDIDEQCDDGPQSGGCCTPTCQFAPADTACYDGNPNTTADTCKAGVCVGRYQTTTCGACRDPNDPQDTSYCDPTTNQCVRQTEPCPPFLIEEDGSENKCVPNSGRDPATGQCLYRAKTCIPQGCFKVACDPTDGVCKPTDASDPANAECEGDDGFCRRDPACETTLCAFEICDPQGDRSNCDSVTIVNCRPETNPSTCQFSWIVTVPKQGLRQGCRLDVGCVYEGVGCAQSENPCEQLVRDPNAEGCCTYEPRDCAAEFGNNPNYTYTCDPNATNGVCQATLNPETCNGADDNGNGSVDEGFPDTDGDAQANCIDPDDDGDGAPDATDAFPLNPNESVDTDADGVGNNADPDDDGDAQTDADELACGSNPLSAVSKSLDTDSDSRPNCVDADDDNDGVADATDNCPLNPNADQADADGDMQGDVCDATPNGAVQIVFSSNRDSFSNPEIYGMRADGTGVVRLTNHPAADLAPALSPDKRRVLFTSTRDNNRTEIFVMNSDGTNVRRLTTNSAVEGIATWSPDGTRIAFTTTRDGNAEIYTMNADGTGAVKLTNHGAEDLLPTWSPDSARIAFTTTRDGNVEIYAMSAANGAGLTRLTNNSAVDAEPAWGANNRIVFTSTRGGRSKIYAMNADGSGVVQLTNPASGYDISPDW